MNHSQKPLLLSASAILYFWDMVEADAETATKFYTALNRGKWKSSRPAMDEVERVNDDAQKFLKSHFLENFDFPTKETQDRLTFLLKEFPELVDPDDFSPQSDVFILAEALELSAQAVFSPNHLRSKLLPAAFNKCIAKHQIDVLSADSLRAQK